MKTQFQSSEILKIRLPPFFDQTAGSYITTGADICTIVMKKPNQGSGVTTTYNNSSSPAVTWNSDVHLWTLDIPVTDFVAGLWMFKATSNAANTLPQWRSYQWGGDWVEDVVLAAKIAEGRWKIVGTQLQIFDRDNTTVLRTYDLKDDTGAASVTKIFERTKL